VSGFRGKVPYGRDTSCVIARGSANLDPMKGRSMRRKITAGVVIGSSACVALALTAPAAQASSTSSGRRVLQKAPSWVTHAHRVGAVSGGTVQHLTAVLNLRNEAGAEALAMAVSTPGNKSYGHYVTPTQWRDQFAPTNADVASVVSWLKANGFSVGSIPANHRYIDFSGSTAATQKAFGTALSTFDKNGTTVSAPTTSVSIPDGLASIVAGIQGLDTSQIQTPLHTNGATALPAAAPTTATPNGKLPGPPAVFRNAGPCSTYYGQKPATGLPQAVADPQSYAPCGYTPEQLRSAYGINRSLANGVDGRGATVAIVDAFASPTIYQDASDYAAKNDPSHPLKSYQFSQNLPASYNHVNLCGGNGWYGEETLDVEAVHATAPGANILYVGGASCLDSDLDAAVNTVVDNNLAQVISNSYGDSGEPSSQAAVAEEHQTFLQAAAQGISVLFSSGDEGDDIVATGTRQTDYPASDPMVTAVGGTSLAVTKTGGYGFEQGWGTGKSTLTSGAWSPLPPTWIYGGGGGTSTLFEQPSYQAGVVPDSIANYFGHGPMRAVPDVAMVGDPNTGFLVGERQQFPNGSVKYSEYRIGGTSLSSPLFAGVVADAVQAGQHKVGFLNPWLYQKVGSRDFRDVNHQGVTDAVVRVDFANGVNKKDGTITSLRTLNQTQTISTGPGYDDVTGVGTPMGWAFISGLGG